MLDDKVNEDQARNRLLALNDQERQFLADFILEMGSDNLSALLEFLHTRINEKDYSRKVLIYRLALLKIGEIMEVEVEDT